MTKLSLVSDPNQFVAILFEKMKEINPGIDQMEFYEFRYSLNNITPPNGWESIDVKSPDEMESIINNRSFYSNVKIKEKCSGKIILDPCIFELTDILFVGLVTELYTSNWINQHFYFDLRGFNFFHKTTYFTDKIKKHLGNKPHKAFEKKQLSFTSAHEIGYKAFMKANEQIDREFIESTLKLVSKMGTPLLIAIAGPTAAGKTEIVERLTEEFAKNGRIITSIELDNFLTDRDYREERGIFTQGKEALHFELFKSSLFDISHGKKIVIPRYNFIDATSSHDLEGNLKADGKPIEIEPADIIFIEGNFPFLLDEIFPLIGLKIVYLTDDHVRLLRKWRRDIDYRKKYEPTYFRNRYFKDQFVMAEIAYRPQMEVCDMVVDTTQAELWVTDEIKRLLY